MSAVCVCVCVCLRLNSQKVVHCFLTWSDLVVTKTNFPVSAMIKCDEDAKRRRWVGALVRVKQCVCVHVYIGSRWNFRSWNLYTDWGPFTLYRQLPIVTPVTDSSVLMDRTCWQREGGKNKRQQAGWWRGEEQVKRRKGGMCTDLWIFLKVIVKRGGGEFLT